MESIRGIPEAKYGYDEPMAMRDSLIKEGVDSLHIVLDYDGTRTLNSIAKMRDGYRQDSIVIISQKYHNERALYQAKHLGIDAIGYNAKTPGRYTSWWRNRGREVLARVKLFIDIARGVQPDIKELPASGDQSFYDEASPKYHHKQPLPYASNFMILKIK